jgi:hypothetical protein
LKEALAELLENFDDDEEGDGEDDDVITLRGPSARALLGILEGGGSESGGEGGKGEGGDGGGDPDPEPGPQRGQSKYFAGGEKS